MTKQPNSNRNGAGIASKNGYHLNLVFSESKVEALEEKVNDVYSKLERIETLLSNFDRFSSYPKWITKEQALEILPFKSAYELNKWASRGVVTFKSVSSRIKVYLKSDCIDFPDRAEDWRIRMAINSK